jgi:hypothetical protein
MAHTTQVDWERPLDESTEGQLIQEYLNNAVAAGKTDGTYTGTHPIIRTWATTTDAQDWVNFMNSFNPPPAAAVVVDTVIAPAPK